MKFSPQSTQSDELQIDITSLIDVVFLLLIFFMVSTTFNNTAGIQVDLPKTSNTAENKADKEPLIVTINKNGELFYKESKTSIEELRALFADLSKQPEQLIVRADTATAHGAVVAVMDLAQQSGITKISIAAESDIAK